MVQPSGDFSASPDDEFGLRLNSLSHPSSVLANCSAANPMDDYSAKLWRTSRDRSYNTSGRLPPRPSEAPTSICAAGNLDVILPKNADVPRKQAFSPYPGVVTTTTEWVATPPRLRCMDNPSVSVSALCGKPSDASQQHSAPSRRLAGRQDISTSDTTPGFTADAPSCINPRDTGTTGQATHRRTLSSPLGLLGLRYWNLPQSFLGTWGLPLSRSACNPYCRHLGASNISIIPPLLEVGPCVARTRIIVLELAPKRKEAISKAMIAALAVCRLGKLRPFPG